MAKIDWREGLELEQEVSKLIHEQETTGVYFDLDKAHNQINWLASEKDKLYKEIREYLTYDIVCKETSNSVTKIYKVSNFHYKLLYKGEKNYVKNIKLKSGKYTSSVLNWFDDPSIIIGPFSRISIEEPSISKRTLIVKQLLALGWKPKEFSPKGAPKLTVKGEPVSTIIKVGSFGKALASWYTYNHRQSQIVGFLPYVRSDGRISAQLNPCGTNTFRARHRVVANIPRPTSIFGKEMRSLFCVPEGKVAINIDVAGLEIRMLAHHMKDPEYIKQILEGDIHSYNQEMAGLPTRDNAKTFFYGYLYGSGDAKTGEIIGGSSKQGKAIKERFLNSLPKLKSLISRVNSFATRQGWVPSIDGRKIWLRSFEGKVLTYTALNALLQANGSIVTKRFMIIADKALKEAELDIKQTIWYHDENLYECSKEDADAAVVILENSMRLAGEYYNLNIPIEGDAAVGYDWGIH